MIAGLRDITRTLVIVATDGPEDGDIAGQETPEQLRSARQRRAA